MGIFKQLEASLKQAIEIQRGNTSPSRITRYNASNLDANKPDAVKPADKHNTQNTNHKN